MAIAKMCLLTLGVWAVSNLFAVPTPELLARAKAAYQERTAQVERETNARLSNLNQDYLRALETLDTQFKTKGELNSLLAVRNEIERFKKQQVVTANDMAPFPPALTAQQRSYLEIYTQLEQAREAQFIKHTKAYLDELENLKRMYTRQDQIAAALEVQKEQEQVRRTVVLDETTAPHTPAAVSATETAMIHPTLKPPPGYVWVMVTDRGLPVKDAEVICQEKGTQEYVRYQTDMMGKISIRAPSGTQYRVLFISEKFARMELSSVEAGNCYWLKVEPYPKGHGLVEVRKTGFALPEVGQFKPNGNWNFEKRTGPMFKPADDKVQIKDPSFGQQPNLFIVGLHEQANTVILGKIQYQVTFFKVGADRYVAEYKKIQ